LLEVAVWDPTIIRRMGTALRARSEASKRFERGVDYELPPLVQRRALSLLQRIAGGRVAQGMVDNYPRPWKPTVLDLTPHEVRRIVGVSLSAADIADLLHPLGFACDLIDDGAAVRVTAPSSRRDITMLADLCEEVARMYGYDRIPLTLMADALPEQRNNPSLELELRARDLLTGAGLDEAITYSLTSMAAVAAVNPADADATLYLRLANPLTPEREYLRRSLLPTLLEALAQNLRERERVLLFEIGRVYLKRAPGSDEPRPEEPKRLALAMAGRRHERSWHTPDEAGMDFFDLKGIVEMLLARLNISGVHYIPLTDDPRFHPGRAARLEHDGRVIGVIGELHPEVGERLEIAAPRAMAAELDLDLIGALVEPIRYRAISRYPATTQDLSLVAAITVPAERAAATIRKYAGALLESLTLFDVYEGEQVGAGKRSLTYRLVFRAPDRTLNDVEIARIRQKIVRGLEHDLGATIRG
jgi:phenylalanyl-tRNA synthetase beta chain